MTRPISLTFLGTGTSTGVPQINCHCPVCSSPDARDKRLRSSALLRVGGRTLLIDAGPDLRTQLLAHPTPHIDALLVTHSHYDHVGGIDDLRPFCYSHGHEMKMPVYCTRDVAADLRSRVPYCFKRHPYPGVPTFDLRDVTPSEPFKVAGIDILPVEVLHWKLPIVGFRVGPLAYITDCKTMPDATVRALKGVDTLVINALRKEEHLSHLSLSQALELVEMIKPRRTFLTHIAHQMGLHAEVDPTLPEGVHLAYDGLVLDGMSL